MSEELDFEAEISSSSNVNIIEVAARNEDAIQFDPGEVEDDTIELHSNASEVLNDAGESPSNFEEVDYTIETQSNNRDVESDIGTSQFITGEILPDAGEVHSDTGEIQSDTGEIENGENLEEGEIEDNAPISNKNPEETVCRFFKRGYCLYGSECRNLHVSNKVYNMFETVISNKSNLNSLELQKTCVPATFYPTPVLIMPDIESPWERGIKNAKVVMENANFRKNNQEDFESDWKRCLEIAKQNIHQKARSKRQSCGDVKPYFDSKYCEQEKFRERDPPLKRGPENKISKSYRQKFPSFSYSKYKKEPNFEKTTSDVKQTPDHLKWVDPWQRSKSPRKRTKSFSLSPSPSMKRSRKGSISSSSSSSSCFNRIYGSPPQSKSPKRFRSASQSSSVFSCTKKSSSFKKRSHSRGRSYSRSPSKSRSKSSRRSCCSASCSSSRTSSVSSEDLPEKKKSNVKALPSNKLVSKTEKHCISTENTKDIYRSSTIKRTYNKASSRTSSPCHSDKSSCSDISMSSLSYTSLSSSGKGTLESSYTKGREGNTISRSKVDKVPQDGSRSAPKPEQGCPKSNAFNKLSKVSEQRRVLSPDRKKLLMYNDTSSKTKSIKTATSEASSLNKPVSLVSKPPITKNVTAQKPSKATMELLKYHSFGRSRNSVSSSTQAAQSNVISPIPTEAANSAAAFKITNTQTKASEMALPKITCNVKPKPQKPVDSTVTLKVTGSKRQLLLQQLQAIDEAIARKKQPLP